MQNIVILAGNIGQSPEVRTTQGGTKITNFTLAISRLSEGRGQREKNSYWVIETDWHCRAGRLMRENGIVVERMRKFKATTDSDHTFNIALNLLDRDFTADRPNQKWAGDISYIWTREGWLDLAVILDLHSRGASGGPSVTA